MKAAAIRVAQARRQGQAVRDRAERARLIALIRAAFAGMGSEFPLNDPAYRLMLDNADLEHLRREVLNVDKYAAQRRAMAARARIEAEVAQEQADARADLHRKQPPPADRGPQTRPGLLHRLLGRAGL